MKRTLILLRYHSSLKAIPVSLLLMACLIFLVMQPLAYGRDFQWVKKMTSPKTDQGNGAAVDAEGNVYTTGYFNDTAHFDNDFLVSYGNNDIYLAKYRNNGDLIWVKGMGGTGSDIGSAVVTDKDGNVYLTGSVSVGGDIHFNGADTKGIITSFGSTDIFIAKYDKDGTFLWVKNFGGTQAESANSITVDHDGNVIITGGYKSQPADFNPGGSGGSISNQGSTKNSDIFMAKYDKDGNFLWVRAMGGTGNNNGYGIAANSKNEIFVVGTYNGTAYFDGTNTSSSVTTVGAYDMFLAKYDKDGNYEWVKSMGGAKNDHCLGVAIDNNDNVSIVGYFDSPVLDFNPGVKGPDTLENQGGSIDIYLAKLDAAGKLLWARAVGGSKQDHGQAIALDRAGNAYITGTFESPMINFNFESTSDTVSNAGAYNIFLAKYGADGSYIWGKAMGGEKHDWGKALAVTPSGSVYMAGYYSSNTADFNKGGNNGEITSDGSSYDGFLAKYGCLDTSLISLNIRTCERNYILGDSVYTEDGIYTQIGINRFGCDSTINLDLTFYSIKPVINIDEFVLGTTVDTYETYQWILNDTAISGATDSKYTVTQNGNYQVAVTNGEGCTDTSDVYEVTNYTGMTDLDGLPEQIVVYPNPTEDEVNVTSPVAVRLALTDITGRLIKTTDEGDHKLSIKELSEGIYILRITNTDGMLIKTEKLVKGR